MNRSNHREVLDRASPLALSQDRELERRQKTAAVQDPAASMPAQESDARTSVRRIVTLDVREDIRKGREPFAKIMSAASTLQPDEELRLIAPFEPVPLFRVLAKQGFQHTAQEIASGDWEVMFSRDSQHVCSSRREEAHSSCSTTDPATDQSLLMSAAMQILEMDARGLEPPQPLVRILEALANLPDGSGLHARTDRRPMHLYPQLEERGFSAETKEQSDGSFLTQIRRS